MLRLSLIKDDPQADEVCRHRLVADRKFTEGFSNQSQNQQHQHQHLHGISSKTEWHENILSAWTVESVPKKTSRFDDVNTTNAAGIFSSNISNNASSATSASTPHRTVTGLNESGFVDRKGNSNNNNQQQQQQQPSQKFVGLCLGTSFTQELCQNPTGSLPVQVLKRMRAAGSNTLSVICNVSCIITQTMTNQVTIKDLTEQLLPEEMLSELIMFNSNNNNDNSGNHDNNSNNLHHHHSDPNEALPHFLDTNPEAAAALDLPSDNFKFLRCGADSYGGMHTTRDRHLSAGGENSATRSNNRLSSFDRKQADAALVETLIESLSESESFQNAIGRTSVVFSFYDEGTQAASQMWFLSDAHLPVFGNSDLLLPGIWKSMSGAMSIVRTLSQETVLFAPTSLVAMAGGEFDRILNVAISAATITDSGEGSSFSNNNNPDTKRTQLLQMRQQQERLLDQMQRSLNQSGSSADKLAAERQYQRLLVGEIDLLERRIEEVKSLTDQERNIATELDEKYNTVYQRAKELEDQKKNLVAENRTLNEENRSNNAVAEALQQQIQMLEQRLAAASSSIVAHRQQVTDQRLRLNQDGSEEKKAKSAFEQQLQSKHELAVADAQKHFSQIQQKVTDDARDAEDQFNADMKTLAAEISSLQQQTENDGQKLGEMRANVKANQNLQANLEKEYNDLRDAMNNLMQASPELAAPNPGTILDERRDKLQKSVTEYKYQLSDLKIKLDQVRNRRETVEENVLSSERHLQRNLAQIQLRIPPQLEAQREHCEDEEKCMRESVELEFEATFAEMSNSFYLSMYDRVHNANTRRHQRRHEELRMEVSVAEENLRTSEDKLRQAQASSDVFALRMDQCAKEQEKLREDHRRTIIELQQQLITAESEPVEEAVRREMKTLQQRIASTNAEIELIQGSMMKSPGFTKTGHGASITAASLSGSSSTFASHRSLRAAAPVASEIRQRLKLLRKDSYKRQRAENAKAAELEQRLVSRRSELTEKASLISTIRTTINELHEQLQLRTTQTEERKSELDQLRRSEEAVIKDLEEELDYAKEVSNRHKTENRLQLTRVTQVMQEQEQELARSRHEVAKLERKRNDIIRRMSESNESTLVMELEHEQQKRDELRLELERAGIAASPGSRSGSAAMMMNRDMRSMSSHSNYYDDEMDPNEDDEDEDEDYAATNNNNRSGGHHQYHNNTNSSFQSRSGSNFFTPTNR